MLTISWKKRSVATPMAAPNCTAVFLTNEQFSKLAKFPNLPSESAVGPAVYKGLLIMTTTPSNNRFSSERAKEKDNLCEIHIHT